MSAGPWRVRSTEYLVRDCWLTLRADACVREDGTVLDPFYVVESGDWVCVVALAGGRLIAVDEYRHGAGERSLGLPGGAVDDGEEPVEAGARELREETGYESATWTQLGWSYANAGSRTNRVFFVLARSCELTGQQTEDDAAEVEVVLVDVQDALAPAFFSQSFHQAAMFHAPRALGHVGPA